MRKILTALGASGVLVVGALVAVAVVGTVAVAQESTTDEAPTLTRHHHALLDDALAELVDEGVIDQDAADAVTERVQQKAEERMAEFGDCFRHGRRHHGFLGFAGRGLLEDGVVDADELAQLPDDHPFRDADGPFAAYLDDGELTTDEIKDALTELRESGEGSLFEFRGRSFHRFGPFGTDTMPEDAEASDV